MYCPACGTETNEQTKYCTKCGINLRSIREAHEHETHKSQVNPERPWWYEMALSEHKKSPEEKRINEIKEGVITSCVGLSLIIFLFFLLDAVSINLDPKVSAILHAVPFVGIIPFLIGLGITFNGLFVSKRLVELKREQEQARKQPLFSSVQETAPVHSLPDSSRAPIEFSVTESTTTKLQEPAPISANRDTN